MNKLDPSKSLFTQNQVEDFLNQEIEPEKLVEGEFVEDILDLHQLRNAQAQKSLDYLSSLKVKDFDLNDPEQYVEIVDANYAKSEERRLRRIFQLIRSKAILLVSQLGFPEDRAIEKSIDAVREMLKAMSESEIRSTNTSLDYLDSLLKSIDSHSAVYQQSAESFMAGLHSVQKLSLGVTFEPRYGGAKIQMIIPNGRADQSGFEVGDTVVSLSLIHI